MKYHQLLNRFLFFSLFFVVLVASVSFAQSVATTGSIQGTASSKDGAPLPGVTIKVSNLDTGLVRNLTTNENGSYIARFLPLSNNYQLEATLEGFSKLTQSGIKVALGSQLTINLTMELSSVQEVMVVTSEAPIIEVGKSEYTTTISDEAIATLPLNGRDYTDFVMLTPMSTISTERNGLSLSGARGINSNIMMDGADNNSAFFGEGRGGTRPPFTFSQSAVKEFQVINNGYSAQYGKAGGGIINAVTKSGSNTYHGSLWYFFRDDSFIGKDANDEEYDTFDQKQLGLTFSGPLIKDKLFMFLCYDSQRYESTQFSYLYAEQDTF
ncbi:carboxypeptidase regulatory-like domain-containing protein, partial [candidate division CSSED10-310 bacterium]